MQKIVLIALFFINYNAVFGNQHDLLHQAQNALAKKDFETALNLYKKIELSGLVGAGMYQNMALAAAALHEDAKAILYLEKALKYAPNDASIMNNLAAILKRNSQLDYYAQNQNLTFYIYKVTGILSISSWIILSLILLSTIGWMIYRHYPLAWYSKKFKYTIFGLSILFILCSTAGYFRHMYIYHNKGIIITQSNSVLKIGPDEVSPELTELPLGTKVYLLDNIGSWWLVETSYGDKGWIPVSVGERI